jgi:hypothetical protein
MASASGELFAGCLARPDRLGAGCSSTPVDDDSSREEGRGAAMVPPGGGSSESSP